MAKITGPLFSFGASGTIARTITFRGSRRGSVANHRQQHRKPPTPQQLSERNSLITCAAFWNAADSAYKSTWSSIAQNHRIPVFPQFFSEWKRQQATPSTPPQLIPQ